jgi:hypothetical protein
MIHLILQRVALFRHHNLVGLTVRAGATFLLEHCKYLAQT